MKNIKLISSITFLALLLVSCGEFESQVNFEEPIQGRTVDLSKKVGEHFQVLREDDTISYSLSYDKETDINYLIRSGSDTIFVGTVTKRNELYLLNRLLQNGEYSIHALKFTDSTVTGLDTEILQSYIINNELDSGSFNNLITDTTGINTIKAEKKDGREIFRLVIEKLDAEKLLVPTYANDLSGDKESAHTNESSTQPIFEESTLISKVYPNPFVDQITIELNEEAVYIFEVYDMRGQLKKASKLNTRNTQLDLQDLSSGQYVLKVFDARMGESDEVRLIKK